MLLIFTPEAYEDIDEIVEYVDKVDPNLAREIGDALFAAADWLAENPKAGRVIEELDENYRWVLVYKRKYKIYYQIKDKVGHCKALAVV
jgi:plasmid stabilization system protein ParE